MNKRTRRFLALTLAATAATVGIAVPAYADDTAVGGAVSCGPDQQVRISTQTSAAVPVTHGWTTLGGTTFASFHGAAFTQTTYTGSRAISSWSAVAHGNAHFTSAGAACS